MGDDAQVLAPPGRPQVGARRTVAPALALGRLDVAHAHLRRRVDVLAEGHALPSRRSPPGRGRADAASGCEETESGPPAPRYSLGAALVSPPGGGSRGARCSKSQPRQPSAAQLVVVLGRAPHERGGVDRAGAAQHLAARHVVLAPAAGGVGLGHEAPVVARVGDADRAWSPAGIRMTRRRSEPPASSSSTLLRPSSESRAATTLPAGAGADDDIVRLVVRPASPGPSMLRSALRGSGAAADGRLAG